MAHLTTPADITDSLQYIGDNEPSIEAELRAVRELKDPNETQTPNPKPQPTQAKPQTNKPWLPQTQKPATANKQKAAGGKRTNSPSPAKDKPPKAAAPKIGLTGSDSPAKGLSPNIRAIFNQPTLNHLLEMQLQAAQTTGRPEPKVALNKPLRR